MPVHSAHICINKDGQLWFGLLNVNVFLRAFPVKLIHLLGANLILPPVNVIMCLKLTFSIEFTSIAPQC